MIEDYTKLDLAKVIECQHCGSLDEVVMRESDYITYVDYILHSQHSRVTKMNNFEVFFPYFGMREKRLLISGMCEKCAESFTGYIKRGSRSTVERGDV
mgnify:CR=1 FL=1